MIWLRRHATGVCAFALVVLAFGQRPGKVTFDTKLDLAVDPLGFLGRALHLWNPQASSGELQNQAYGYLFPVGPFFGLGELAQLPPWVTQRLWCALLLVLGFAGTLKLGRALRLGTEPTRYVAAMAYALAPRTLTEIGPLSAEMLPVVLVPWVMLPLVRSERFASARRAAGCSALAVLAMGGINAAMVLAVLILPGLWLLTRVWTREHVRLLGWWCGFVLAVCLWWMLPLVLLGRYSMPFLNYIEASTNTTGPVSLQQVLRGADQWIAYLPSNPPWWPAGYALVADPVLVPVTLAIALIGLLGLLRAGLPHRRFLILATITGLTLVAIGYLGPLGSPLASPVRSLLDGPLAPLRNVHKFDPVLRQPLLLSFAHALAVPWTPIAAKVVPPRVRTRLRRLRESASPRPGTARIGIACGLIAIMASPAWLGLLRPGPGWDAVSGYWRSTMNWLGRQAPQARTLLVPATGFGQYTWGRTVDEPAQPLARAPWSVRNQVPLGSEGNTRVLDAIQDQLERGAGSPALADLLSRSGFHFLLLRNDLASTESPPRTLSRATLSSSPGIEKVAEFGPPTTSRVSDEDSSVQQHAPPAPAVEIYAVRRPVPRAEITLTDDVPTVSGGPEALVPMLAQQVVRPDQPTVFAADRVSRNADRRWVVTDGLRKRERNMGTATDNLSQTMTERQQPRVRRPAHDIVPFPDRDEHRTTARYRGIAGIRASSSAGFADTPSHPDPSALPFAAVDGDPNTAWRSTAANGGVGQWLRLDLGKPTFVDTLSLRTVRDLRVGWPVTKVRVTTDKGSVNSPVSESGAQTIRLPPGETRSIRVTVLELAGGRSTGEVGISDLSVPGIQPMRELRPPEDGPPPDAPPPTFSFSRGPDPRQSCFTEPAPDGARTRCDSTLARTGEEPFGPRRVFHVPTPARYEPRLTVLPARGADPPLPPDPAGDRPEASASSELGGDPTVSAHAAFDGDPRTAWIAHDRDPRPALRLTWPHEREIHQLRVAFPREPRASAPVEVELRTPTESRTVHLDEDGAASFPPLHGTSLELRVRRSLPVFGDERFPATPNPPGIAELALDGRDEPVQPADPARPYTVTCGQGPDLVLDGRRFPTSVTGTLGQYLARQPLPAHACGTDAGLAVSSGEHHLSTTPNSSFVTQDIALRPAGPASTAPRTTATQRQENHVPPTSPASGPARVRHRDSKIGAWSDSHRTIDVGPGAEAVLSVPENANPGWRARMHGADLRPTRVDGWQQAWIVPAGPGGTVELDFTPNSSYQVSLDAGGVTALGAVLAVAIPARGGRRPRPSRSHRGRWPAVTSSVLLAALGGVFGSVALLVAILTVRRSPRGLRGLRFAACAAATTSMLTPVIGSLAGYGTASAYSGLAQASLLILLAVTVATLFTPKARLFTPKARELRHTSDAEHES